MPVVEISQTVDARGLSCPMPIVKTAQAVKALPSGRRHRAPRDRRRLRSRTSRPGASATGNELVEQTSDGAVYRFVIRRK